MDVSAVAMTTEAALTLAVVGMPSIFALCSASFLAIRSLSSSVLSGILDLDSEKGIKCSSVLTIHLSSESAICLPQQLPSQLLLGFFFLS